jgi:hypothetical protein
MIPENLNEEINPRDIEDAGTSSDREKPEPNEDEQDWDILPSNGPGLAGDDGEQVVDYDEEDEDDEGDDD